MQLFESVGKYLARERAGRPVFGLLGDANLGYMGVFVEQKNGNYLPAVHEGGAVSMGDGWARSTRQVAVVTVTHGPALTNTLTALTEAVKSRTPMVVLSGSTPEVNEHYQYVDLEGFARLSGANFLKVRNAGEVASILDRAFARATVDRAPVLVDIPAGLLREEVVYRDPRILESSGARRGPDPDAVAETAELLASARRPLIIAGRGAVDSGAREELLRLARRINAPVVTTLLAKDYFKGEPENLGVLGGLSLPPAVSYSESADVVISFGAALNGFTTNEFALLEGRTLIQCDIEPAALSGFGPATHGIVADAKSFASALLDSLGASGGQTRRAAYMEEIESQHYRESTDLYASTTGEGFVDMRDATRWLSTALPEGAQQVCDVGRFGYSTWPHISVDPKRWFYVGGFGSIGLGLASATGIAIANSNSPTALYVGDGGLMQGIGELATAVRRNLPLVVMVLNDGCYGAEYLKLQQFGVSADHSMMSWPSFAEMAQGMGVEAIRATSMEDLVGIEDKLATLDRPLLIDVIADPSKVANSPGVVPVPN